MRYASRAALAALPVLPLALAPIVMAPASTAAAFANVDATVSESAPINPEQGADLVRDDYTGHVQVVRGRAADEKVLVGTVFEDANKNSKRDRGESGIAGVMVSNGRDVVTTDSKGSYRLPAFDRMTVSMTQPAGYAVPVDEDNLAQYVYNHFPNGSPELKYGGVKPTGPLPKAVNFPMVRSAATAKADQNCVVAADTQPFNVTEVNYAKQGAVRELMTREDIGGCGIMMLGDNAFDDLSLYDEIKDIYRLAKGPIRSVAGNHDLDFDAKDNEHSTDTYRANYGPLNHSYEVGRAHFVALHSIEYGGGTAEGKEGPYREVVSAEQLEWLKKDLANVPANKLVVVHTHAPVVSYLGIAGIANANEIFDILKANGRTAENTVFTGGHTHTRENIRPGAKRAEWKEKQGIEEMPFPLLIAGAVAGGWYEGNLDGNGLPFAIGFDGNRPGTLTISLRGSEYIETYKVRQRPWKERFSLGVNSPTWRAWAPEALAWRDSKDPNKGPQPTMGDLNVVTRADLKDGTWISANFIGASYDDTVEVSVDGRAYQVAELAQPTRGESLNSGFEYSDVTAANASLLSSNGRVTTGSSTVWRANLPTDLSNGTHQVRVKGTDRHGRVYSDNIMVTVVDERPAPKAAATNG